MNLCTVFVIFVFIGSIFNVCAEPRFRKPRSGEIQKNKRIIVKQTGRHVSKHRGHRGHRKPLPCMSVAQAVNASSLKPVAAISVPFIPGPLIPDAFFPGTVVGTVIIIPDGGSSVTTAATGAATTFVPGM